MGDGEQAGDVVVDFDLELAVVIQKMESSVSAALVTCASTRRRRPPVRASASYRQASRRPLDEPKPFQVA